jgi:hypothetical protein
MVRRLAAPIVVLLAAGLLAGCGFFIASPFPQYLAQVTHQRSVSLGDLESGQVVMKVMNNGTRELLFLLHLPPVENSRLLILDEQLGIVNQYEEDRSTSDNLLGGLMMVTLSSEFLCGTVLFDASGAFTGTLYSSLQNYVGNRGFYTAGTEYRLFDMGTRNLSQNAILNNSFAFAGSDAGVDLSSPAVYYSLREIFHDVPANQVAFYFRLEGYQRIEGVLYQASGFAFNTPFLAGPIHFAIDNIDLESVHYTRDGTVIRSMEEDGGRRKLKLVGFDGAVKAEFPEYEHRTVEAYAAEGDHYYFLDLEQGILYRANTWW